MTTTALKKQIHQFVDVSDDKILKVVHTILEEHTTLKSHSEFDLTDEDVTMLDERWNNYKKGKSKTYTLAETKLRVSKNLKTLKH
ncbi:MAG: hypothetical protein KF900_04395 [Bacteroidetes bacterium]|nr:hypothetical protein [Bacteroidota bacterium]